MHVSETGYSRIRLMQNINPNNGIYLVKDSFINSNFMLALMRVQSIEEKIPQKRLIVEWWIVEPTSRLSRDFGPTQRDVMDHLREDASWKSFTRTSKVCLIELSPSHVPIHHLQSAMCPMTSFGGPGNLNLLHYVLIVFARETLRRAEDVIRDQNDTVWHRFCGLGIFGRSGAYQQTVAIQDVNEPISPQRMESRLFFSALC